MAIGAGHAGHAVGHHRESLVVPALEFPVFAVAQHRGRARLEGRFGKLPGQCLGGYLGSYLGGRLEEHLGGHLEGRLEEIP